MRNTKTSDDNNRVIQTAHTDRVVEPSTVSRVQRTSTQTSTGRPLTYTDTHSIKADVPNNALKTGVLLSSSADVNQSAVSTVTASSLSDVPRLVVDAVALRPYGQLAVTKLVDSAGHDIVVKKHTAQVVVSQAASQTAVHTLLASHTAEVVVSQAVSQTAVHTLLASHTAVVAPEHSQQTVLVSSEHSYPQQLLLADSVTLTAYEPSVDTVTGQVTMPVMNAAADVVDYNTHHYHHHHHHG